MRQIVTLPDEAAQKFADYLLTLKIETQLHHDKDGQAVWVCDEDRVPQARQELEAFLRNPTDARYGRASSVAQEIREDEEQTEEEYRERQRAFREQVEAAGTPGPIPLTLVVMALAILVAVATNLGKNRDAELLQKLLITNQPDQWPRLVEVASGEVWRLVTPIFIHFGLMHIVFDLFVFLRLAGQIESLRGTGRLLFLILVTAVLSNLVQYYLGGTTLVGWWPVFNGTWYFGGLSGVVYGLFGYVWMKSILEPEQGLHLTADNVVFLLLWFFLCFYLQNIGNGAHAGGLVVGVVLGAMPGLWRRVRPS